MKQTIALGITIGLLLIGLSPLFTCTGCKTPQQTQQALDIITTLADTGMETYVQVALAGDITPEKKAKVENQLAAYRAAMAAARTAYNTYLTNPDSRPAFLQALAALSAARVQLVDLVISLKKTTPSN